MSLTFSGLFSGILLFVFKQFGIEVGTEDIQGFVNVVLGVFSVVAIVYGRWRLGGVNIFGLRK